MHYDWEQAAAKKEKKRQCSATLTVFGWKGNMAVYIASSESSKPKRFVRR